ncbi:DUF1659 domain-containing protein [Lederbergia citrea]|uniref:DUF1659 domain-containing protein n=1 Tax=Lederbergia citrea TaxID=2833581 RepID=A0A942UHZ4_9BACI|nr:DUF1659 domain-containing protein [Lederbergia citrea]MBS4176943.1 DUF1659 domain-containing protein [Lederbergia citrea]MBS4203502.1 DUF1659 domain-containing protein [Lederbergia citrea]MBS4221826.1 DUF1659 domain-containing protein [Lederbergia citrea]
MAEAYLKATKLKLVFDYGMDKHNKPVYKTKTFNNIHRNASADQLYQACQAISTLKSEPLWAIERNDTINIDE